MTMGSSFCLFVLDRGRHELYRVPITISGGTAQAVSPAFDTGAGSYPTARTGRSRPERPARRSVTPRTAPRRAQRTEAPIPRHSTSRRPRPSRRVALKAGQLDSSLSVATYVIGGAPTQMLNNTGFELNAAGWAANGPGVLTRISSDVQSGIGAIQYTGRTSNWNGPRQALPTPCR